MASHGRFASRRMGYQSVGKLMTKNGAVPPCFQKSTEVNSLFLNRVSHLTRALFLTSTPVPLTAWKRVPYSQKSSKIRGRGVVSLSPGKNI